MYDTLPPGGEEARLVRLPEVMRRTGLKKTKIYKMVREDEFPKPRKEGRASLWRNSDLNTWIEQR